VLKAFVQVGDSLTGFDHDTALLAAQKHAFDVASESLRLERISYATGASGILNVLNAQRQFEQSSFGYAQVQGKLFLDTIQLMVAVGGGWETGRVVARNDRSADLEPPE